MRHVAFWVLGIKVSLSLVAQVALDFSSTTTPSGGTGWQAISNTTSGKVFSDNSTSSSASSNLVTFSTLSGSSSSSIAYDQLTINLVGGSGTTWTTNPMLQIQTGYIGGTTSSDLGVAFQVRLAGYDLAAVNRLSGITVLVGVSPTNGNSTDYSTFVIGASISSNGSSVTGSSLFVLDSGSSTGLNKTGDFVVGNKQFLNSTLLAQSSSGLASGYIGYSSVANTFNAGSTTLSGTPATTYTDSADALLSFAVKFSSINDATNGISAAARGSTVFDATTSKWEFTVGTASGVFSGTGTKNTSTSATGYAVYDGLGTSGNLQATDAFFTNGSSVSGSVPTVPEAPTFVWFAGLLLPIHWIMRRRRRRTTEVQQLTTA